MIELHPLRESDIEPLASWLPDVAKAAGCETWSDSTRLPGAVGRDDVLVAGGREAFLHYETNRPNQGGALVRFLAVEPGQRRLGIGGRVALTLEQRVRGSAARMYVAVPAEIGLALYFWLRLGYRPLTQPEWPAPPERAPSTWMVRGIR